MPGLKTKTDREAREYMAQDRIPTWQLMLFASPAIPLAALGLPITVYLPQFYGEQMGLGLATVGTVFMIARLWDVVTDPMMGIISDKFPTRWGKRRHWIALSLPIVVLCAVMVFMPSGGVSSMYLFGWMFVLYIGYTMLNINLLAWGAELHEDYDQRSRIMGFYQGAAIFGVPIVLLIPVFIESMGGPNVEADRIAAMGWFIVILLPIAAGFAIWKVPEFPQRAHHKELTFKEAVKPLLSNHTLQRVILADFLSGFSGGALGSMFLYQASYVWGLGGSASLLLLLYFFAGVGFVPIVVRISYRMGKHQTLVYAALFTAVFAPIMFLIPPGNFWVAAAVLSFLGINVGSLTILYRSILADVVNLDELESGQRRTGLFFSLLTLTAKTGNALSVGVVFWTLALIGFVPGSENSGDAVSGLNITFIAVPVICNLGVAAIMWSFPLDKSRQEDIRRQLEDRAAAKASEGQS